MTISPEIIAKIPSSWYEICSTAVFASNANDMDWLNHTQSMRYQYLSKIMQEKIKCIRLYPVDHFIHVVLRGHVFMQNKINIENENIVLLMMIMIYDTIVSLIKSTFVLGPIVCLYDNMVLKWIQLDIVLIQSERSDNWFLWQSLTYIVFANILWVLRSNPYH